MSEINSGISEAYMPVINSVKKCEYKNLDATQLAVLLKKLVTACGNAEGYTFTCAMTELIDDHGPDIENALLHILKCSKDPECPYEKDTLFTSYYGLSILYKRQEKQRPLGAMIERYKDVFAEYPLNYEVRSRYYKRAGELRLALECDRKAGEMLAPGFNYGVGISFASSVSMMLEQGIDVADSDVALARKHINEAILFNDSYPKHQLLMGKLTLLSLDPEKGATAAFKNGIATAKKHFKTAIELADVKSSSYFSKVQEPKYYMSLSDSMAREAVLSSRVNAKFESVNVEIEKRLMANQYKMLEFLALFTAIIQIIMVSIGFISKEFTLLESMMHIIMLNLCTLCVYCTVLVIKSNKSDENRKKPLVALIISSILVVLLYLAALFSFV